MTNLTPEKEAEILAALTAKVAAVADAVNVVADEPLLDSKDNILDTICIQNVDDETEVKFIKIDFLGFEDSDTDGCDDNPVVFLNYNLHVFQQYKEKRSDDSTSTNDIKQLVIALRNRFLEAKNNARQLATKCEHQPLRQQNFIILGDDPLAVGAYGHFTDLICKVEIL